MSKQLTALHLDALAVQASQVSVTTLAAAQPTEPDTVILLAEARHNLLARLLPIGATSDAAAAAALVHDILAGYRAYVSVPPLTIFRASSATSTILSTFPEGSARPTSRSSRNKHLMPLNALV